MARADHFRNLFTENISYKGLALIITVFLWTFVMGRDDALDTKDLSVEVLLPVTHELLIMQPSKVQVTLKGTPKLLRRYFNNKKKLRFSVYNTANNELRIEIRDEKLEVPFGLRVVGITPRHVDVRMKVKPGFEEQVKQQNELLKSDSEEKDFE